MVLVTVTLSVRDISKLEIVHQAKAASRTKLNIYCSWILKCKFPRSFPTEKTRWEKPPPSPSNNRAQLTTCNKQSLTKPSQTWTFYDFAPNNSSSLIKQSQTSPCHTRCVPSSNPVLHLAVWVSSIYGKRLCPNQHCLTSAGLLQADGSSAGAALLSRLAAVRWAARPE